MLNIDIKLGCLLLAYSTEGDVEGYGSAKEKRNMREKSQKRSERFEPVTSCFRMCGVIH